MHYDSIRTIADAGLTEIQKEWKKVYNAICAENSHLSLTLVRWLTNLEMRVRAVENPGGYDPVAMNAAAKAAQDKAAADAAAKAAADAAARAAADKASAEAQAANATALGVPPAAAPAAPTSAPAADPINPLLGK